MDTHGKASDFNIFIRLGHFIKTIYFGGISLKQAINRKNEIECLLRELNYYKPKNFDKMESRKKNLKNTKNIFEGRNLIVCAFEEYIFPLPKEEHKNLNSTKSPEMNKVQVDLFQNGLVDLKDRIETVSKNEIEIEKLNETDS